MTTDSDQAALMLPPQAPMRESEPAPPVTAAAGVAAEPAAPAAGPTATAAGLDLPKGSIPPGAVVAMVRAHAQEIQSCFDSGHMDQLYLNACESMGKTPAACRRARVNMSATVAPDGHVTQISTAASRDGTASLEACIRSAVQSWTFPEPAGGASGHVSYPFVFE